MAIGLQHNWFAVYCKYRCEKKVLDQLLKKNIKAYLPLYTKIRLYGTRKRKVELPLISNYVFVNINHASYVQVLETNHILNFVTFSNKPIPIPDDEIDLLKRIVRVPDLNIITENTIYEEGDLVEIISGNLVGLRGILVEKHGVKNLKVNLNTLQQTLTIIVDRKNIMKIHNK